MTQSGDNLSPSRAMWGTRAMWVVLLLAGSLMPLYASGYVLRACSVFYLHLLLGAGLTIVVTYAGLLDLGYIAFFAIGAYTYALLDKSIGLPFFVALPVGALVSALFGLVLGLPTLRVRGDYLALVTLGFGEIVRVLLLNIWGPEGIAGIKPPLSVAYAGGIDNLYILFYVVAFVPVPIALWILSRMDRSKLARTWFAIRDNEIAAKSCGIDSVKWLLLAFALGTMFAGLAGVIFSGIQRYVSPGSFVLEESIFVLSIVVIAAGRSLWRLVIAAAILSFLPEVLRGLVDYRMLIYGGLLSLFVVAEELLKGLFHSRHAGRAARFSPLALLDGARPVSPSLSVKSGGLGWMLSVKNLTMRFGGIVAVDDISFSVSLGGNVVGLIGPNGAGKTTLFNCISGHCTPVAGSVVFPGAVLPHTPSRCAKAGVGRTFQTPQLFHTMTVRENIVVGALLHDGKKRVSPIVDDILDYLGLSPVAETNVRLLPLGMQRLTELGRALAIRPKVILVDEIASGMNSREKQVVASLLRRLSKEAGIGFLLVEHDMDFVLPLVSEMLVLDAGRLIAQGSPADVTGNQAVVDAYLGETDAVS